MAKKILVVDDERHIVRLVEINLQRAGYDVVTAYDGVEALEKVRSEKPDMVVCDNLMPRMTGLEFLQKLRADPATRELPVIMLIGMLSEATADDWDREIKTFWGSGADTVLTKPYNPRELQTFVVRIFQSLDESPLTDDLAWEV